jgi:hypothetical protein
MKRLESLREAIDLVYNLAMGEAKLTNNPSALLAASGIVKYLAAEYGRELDGHLGAA